MILNIPIELIEANPYQTRQGLPDPGNIEELAADIRQNGLLQTPVGRALLDDRPVEPLPELMTKPGWKVQLAFGHNRLAAFRLLASAEPGAGEQWRTMPLELGPLTDMQMADFAWSENERRRDLNPLERALAIQKRMESFGWDQKTAAAHLGVSAPVVSNALRLLRLPEDVKAKLGTGQMSERAAVALLELYDLPESLRMTGEKGFQDIYKPSYIARMAMDGWSSDRVRAAVDDLIRFQAVKLARADTWWSLDDVFEQGEGMQKSSCRSCALRVKDKNLCMDPSCYRARQVAWMKSYLERASQVSGLAILEDARTRWEVMDFSSRLEGKTIRTSGCENLRLIFDTTGGNMSLGEAGFPNALIVCQRQRGRCACLMGLEAMRKAARNSQADSDGASDGAPVASREGETGAIESPEHLMAEDLQEAAREHRRNKRRYEQVADEAKQFAADAIQTGFNGGERWAWLLMLKKWSHRMSRAEMNLAKRLLLEGVQRTVARWLVDDEVGEYTAAEDVPGRLERWLKAAQDLPPEAAPAETIPQL